MDRVEAASQVKRIRELIAVADGIAGRDGRDVKGFATAAMAAYTELVRLRQADPDMADRLEVELRGRIVVGEPSYAERSRDWEEA